MDFLDPALSDYAEKHTSPESETLSQLNRETHAKVLMPRMLSGHLQGRFLSMITHMIRPKTILEIGTYTGYSALCFAEGLPAGGHIHTIDINDELTPMVREYVKKSGFEKSITLHTGDALKIIPAIDGPFDLVFIDADKINYSKYYDLVFDKVPKGGWIVADNVLWNGKVLTPEKTDKDTTAINEYNDKVANDSRVENILVPIRDGLLICRKK
jgi:caffeoyl-CoA O-methyltransferase